MRNKTYKQLSLLVDNYISDTHEFFSSFIHLFENNAKETKTIGYGGYELKRFVDEFNNEMNQKCSELMKEIETIFVNSGRKLSPKQNRDLIEKCIKPFNIISDNFSTSFKKEFYLDGTLEISLSNSMNHIIKKISEFINALNIITNTKIDKALIWTAVGTVFAGISLILSIITITKS